ncbi:maleate cis-trans isomerase family protein [Tranquillimonas rosea]|uniref:maleate cis-trans isomerase family protein n=1 Tax=Tranquillimonas rosea TaxID=641238 RepID=UPI003BAB4AA6
MTLRRFPHEVDPHQLAQIGLVVLQADETIERDFRQVIPPAIEVLVTRIASGADLSPESLSAMEAHLGAAAGLLPQRGRFAAVAYACTSGTAQIGIDRTGALLRGAVATRAVTDPVTALVAACRALGVRRLGLLSPYVPEVSDRLRRVLADAGLETPVFGSFEVADESRVVRIDATSILSAARALAGEGGIDALFLSCTNLRTLGLIGTLESQTHLPVLSSNQVLAWHMARLAGVAVTPALPGRLAALELHEAD